MSFHDEIVTHVGGKYKVLRITEDQLPRLQELIKEKLVRVCYGDEPVNDEPDLYTYKQACKQLHTNLQRYQENMKYGLVGELLMHVIATEMLNFDAESISVILSSQNQNIKPGFDLNFHDQGNNKIWYGEVKSGLDHNDRSELVVNARDGLRGFFDNIDSSDPEKNTFYRWEAAKSEVRNMFASQKKTTLVQLLSADRQSISSSTNNRRSAILMTVNFGSSNFDHDSTDDIDNCVANIENGEYFDDYFIISAHKDLFDDIIDFLGQEAETDA